MRDKVRMGQIEVMLCYTQEDQDEAKKLAVHLGALRRQGFFEIWHDHQVSAGMDWTREVDAHLQRAHIIVLIVSQYFLNSEYCYCVEMAQAIKRHERGAACVIPVILRPVYYDRAPFAKLRSLPSNALPITNWRNRDQAFFDVAEGIRKVAERLT